MPGASMGGFFRDTGIAKNRRVPLMGDAAPQPSYTLLTVSSAAMLHFSFWLGPGISHEMALALVYGANFWRVLHHFRA